MMAGRSAPSLPAAAERPCAVARTEMGKISAARRKVVQLNHQRSLIRTGITLYSLRSELLEERGEVVDGLETGDMLGLSELVIPN